MHKLTNRINAMNPIECAASIDLLRELAESSEVQIDSVLNEWEVKVSLSNHSPSVPTPTADAKGFCNSQLLAALSDAVDWVRSKRGIPSLEQEAQAMEDARPAVPVVLVDMGPDACCHRCQSKAGIRFDRTVSLVQPWDGGLPEVVGIEGAKGFLIRPLPGELGRCQECGMTYKLNA